MSSVALAQPSNGVHETKKRLVESLNGKMSKHVMIAPTQKRVPILGPMLPSTAGCWTKFSWIADKESNELVMVKNDRNDHMFFTACNDCKDVYAYSKGNGTNSLVNHKCSPKMVAATTASGILHFVKHGTPSSHQKKKMLNALSDMCALDLRPFYTVSDAGFRGVIQQALDIGFESKTPLFADNVLCDRTTVKQNCQSRKDSALESLLKDCKDHVVDGLMMGATTDLWMDDDSKKSYIFVTLHRIDEYFRLHDRTLAVREFDGDSHTAPNILANFNDIIEPFITLDDEIRTDLIIVNTDNASNNSGAGGLESEYKRISCADHKVDTCISYVLKKRTREINGVRLSAFYEFEEEAPLGTLALEVFKNSTLHLVAFWRQKLLSHCEPIRETVMQEVDNDVEVELPPDSDDIITIKQHVREQILQKFILEPLHIVATLLDPRQKHRLHRMGINETQVTQGKSDLAALMLKVGPGRTHVSASRRPISNRQGSKSKKRKTVIRFEVGPSICSDDESDVDSKDDAAQEQSAMRWLVSWWRGRAAAFPILARAARCVLAYPAASAKSECNFNNAGNTLIHKRNQLSPNTVDTLLFMRSNITK
ncbi:hypothetical protein CY35_01G146700 [Sphagnum magellanicum]|nr:hypothetical protein CY35_01G146700 [Sphagnum magellanicum]